MSFFKRVWTFLQQTEVPQAGVSQEEILTRICAILSTLDDQQQALLTHLLEFERYVQVVLEQQLAILERLRALVKKEESES